MLSKIIPNFEDGLRELSEIGTSGFTVVFGFSLDGVRYSHSTFPGKWLHIYQKNDLYFADPVFVWSLSNSGTRRWSDIDLPDLRGVMRDAQAFGLQFGGVTSIKSGPFRSLLSVSRDDRELTDAELAFMSETFATWVDLVFKDPGLSFRELDVLRALKDGMGQREIAEALGISESTVKQRTQKAMTKLNSKTRTQAVAQALERGLLQPGQFFL